MQKRTINMKNRHVLFCLQGDLYSEVIATATKHFNLPLWKKIAAPVIWILSCIMISINPAALNYMEESRYWKHDTQHQLLFSGLFVRQTQNNIKFRWFSFLISRERKEENVVGTYLDSVNSLLHLENEELVSSSGLFGGSGRHKSCAPGARPAGNNRLQLRKCVCTRRKQLLLFPPWEENYRTRTMQIFVNQILWVWRRPESVIAQVLIRKTAQVAVLCLITEGEFLWGRERQTLFYFGVKLVRGSDVQCAGMRRRPRRGPDLLFYQTQISEQWVTKHVRLLRRWSESYFRWSRPLTFSFFKTIFLQLNWSFSQLQSGTHALPEGRVRAAAAGNGRSREELGGDEAAASEQPDRPSFCSAARTYPPDQIFTRHVGKPSICIPAILWGPQKQEFHGDHMRTVKEDFLKVNAASLEVGRERGGKKQQLTNTHSFWKTHRL